MTNNNLQPLRELVVDISTRLSAAVDGKSEVRLVDNSRPFGYGRLVTYWFDDFQIELYIEKVPVGTKDDEEPFFRFVNKAILPDKRIYNLRRDFDYLPNPYDLFRKAGGNSDKLVEILKDAK